MWLTDLMCLGDERTLLDCDRSGWGVVNCDHSEDVAIECAQSDTSKRGNSTRTKGFMTEKIVP